MYAIVTDTSANLDSALLERRGICAIPFSFFDAKDEKEQTCLDTHGFDGEAYYEDMRRGTRYVTSQITPQRYIDFMTPILREGRDILFVGMSSGISGAYHSAESAARTLLETFPERKIRLVDTLSASLGEGLIVLHAAERRDAGAALDDLADELTALRRRMCQVFSVDDLKYLHRSGRISGVAALAGNILSIKPLLKGNEEGKIVCFGRVRGRKAAIKALADRYNELVVDAADQTIGIAHAGCAQDAAALAELLRQKNAPGDILTVCYEPVTGSHVGPGTLALFFLGGDDVRSR